MEGGSEANDENRASMRGKLDIMQQISNRKKAISEIEAYLAFCVQDISEDSNLKLLRNKDRIINRINKWAHVLGHQPVTDACRIIDYNIINLLEEHAGEKEVFLVGSADGLQPRYFISSESSHCPCNFFKTKVMETNEAYMCEHLIAIRIAKLLKYERITKPDLLNALDETV